MPSPPFGWHQATPGPSRLAGLEPADARNAPDPMSIVTESSSLRSLASLHHSHSSSHFDNLHNQEPPFPSISQDNVIHRYYDRIPLSHPSHNLHIISQQAPDDIVTRLNPTPLPLYQPPPTPAAIGHIPAVHRTVLTPPGPVPDPPNPVPVEAQPLRPPVICTPAISGCSSTTFAGSCCATCTST